MIYEYNSEDDFSLDDLSRADMMLSALEHLTDEEETSLRMMQLRLFIRLEHLMMTPNRPPPTEADLLLWTAYLDLVGSVEHYVTFQLPFRAGDKRALDYLDSLGIHSEADARERYRPPKYRSRAKRSRSTSTHRTTATGVDLHVVDSDDKE